VTDTLRIIILLSSITVDDRPGSRQTAESLP
jgi:hypothetical protein